MRKLLTLVLALVVVCLPLRSMAEDPYEINVILPQTGGGAFLGNAEIETLKKASVAHRASIAELRRQVSALEKELRRVAKGAARPAAVDSGHEAAGSTKRRFSATRLAAHRAKLGLSAANYGQLIGADSTGRCNTFAEHLSGRVEAERFARYLIQLSRYCVELKL